MSSSQHWLRVRDLVERALDLAAEERDAFLRREYEGDDELLEEVRELLALDTRGGVDPTPPGPGAFERFLGDPSGPRRPPSSRVGRYELLEEVGRGGMGVVYLARRVDGQFERKVAVKLIRRWFDSDEVLQRFELERQVLAGLEHPGIARLIDGGMAPDGRPYLVMEHVDGVPIDRWCDRERLSVEDRVELIREVCAAVDAAHRSLVVHRDLKPGNILVTSEGRPKLLDFGIAKVLAPTDGEAGDPTRTHTRRLTPAYASPEQMRGEPITTACDTYSLGVILYFLLTGRLPIPLAGLSPAEMERAVCEEAPLPPEIEVLRPLARPDERGEVREVSPEEVSAHRRTTPQALARTLSGDLGTILRKALRKERERRYGSAAELAEDLRRCLAGLPVSARPDTWRYRVGKFARRNRKGVIAALVVVAALVGGLALSSWQYRLANVARRELSLQIEVDRRRAEELRQLADRLEEARAAAEANRGRAELHAVELEELAAELREEKALAERERGRAEENLAGVREANAALEHQQSLVETRLEALRVMTRALLSDVHQAIAPVENATRVRARILEIGNDCLDALAEVRGNDGELLREVTGGRLQLVEWSVELRAAGSPVELSLGELCEKVAVGAERIEALVPASRENRRDGALFLGRLGLLELRLGREEQGRAHLRTASELVGELAGSSRGEAWLADALREREAWDAAVAREGG